jgi:hypothetical protein
MRLSVPSTFTTIGPRWSSETVVLPLLMSSWVAFEGAAGRARGAFGVVLGRSSSGPRSDPCSDPRSSGGEEGLEEKIVEDIVNVRDVVVGVLGMVLVVLVRKVGA